jgi:hypothetical protein
MQIHKKEVPMDQRMFRLQVALGLASEWELRGCALDGDNTLSPSKAFSVPNKTVRLHLRSRSDADQSPFDSADGHAEYFEKLPEKQGAKKALKMRADGTLVYPTHRSMYCRYCVKVLQLDKPHRTSFYCKKCQKPLCKGVCFQMWHSMQAKRHSKAQKVTFLAMHTDPCL